ncbi:LPS export ABC transporter periplasmic protein LptC [Phenylobacterium sp.]|jgi:lipopolysaccharide export system protein LptC|uniref:LPS export ABC transporter periplasmic protein LptC n=1 Tax=Phenylobacterium sp. TaxID=1871053 RepID=UPI002E36614B|nr:LPS export ABC transporter periplasmic protein LptC [Phenylobacterium sp.]HEX2560548.1 LPS export ABC transporter periplasmic protein LptC [Phenylobacterium sp.]
MSAVAHPAAGPSRRPDFLRWRRRSRLVRVLRIALPLAISLIFATLVGFVVHGTITGGPAQSDAADMPIRLVNFRLVGRDDRGRAFVLTADSATRDRQDYQRVLLVNPSLLIDSESPRPTRLSSKTGVMHEGTGRLNLDGGVQLNGTDLSVATASSVYDTATGVLQGQGDIAGRTPLGEVNAKSYGVYDEGERLVFRGNVRGRIESK